MRKPTAIQHLRYGLADRRRRNPLGSLKVQVKLKSKQRTIISSGGIERIKYGREGKKQDFVNC